MKNGRIELELIERSPVKLKKKLCDNKRLRYLTDEEQQTLLASCKESKSPHLYEMVFIALYTGLRLGEIQTLTADSLSAEGITVKSEYSKSGRARTVPLSPSAKLFFETASFDYAHEIKNAFKIALKKADIADFHFHDLRHTYASRLVQKGVDLYTLKELLGHQTIEMTMRYSHLSKDNLKKAVEKLE